MSTQEKVLPHGETDILEEEQHELILFNDDVNTFDHVIETLIDVCQHTQEQAHQCSLIVHYKGKCCVKTGELDDLKSRCTLLHQAGLSAEVL